MVTHVLTTNLFVASWQKELSQALSIWVSLTAAIGLVIVIYLR